MGAVLTGLVRHILTILGGSLMTQGVLETNDIDIVSGGLVAIGAVIWSVVSKYRAKKKLDNK